MRKMLICGVLAILSMPAFAQTLSKDNAIKTKTEFHMDLGVDVGTDGIGVDLAMPVGEWVQIRAGFVYMPRVHKQMTFEAQLGDTPEPKYNDKGERIETRFDRIANMMSDFTGYTVDDQVNMIGEPRFMNGKLIVDVFPFKRKDFFFSAGIYAGPSVVGYAYNTTEDMPSLMGMAVYNNIYDKVYNEEAIITYGNAGLELPPEICAKILSAGRMSVPIGVYSHDAEDGSYHKGDAYRVVPNEEGMVKAWVRANAVRPYIGAGYKTPLAADKKVFFSANAGILCWGAPTCTTHDGTDLVNDVENIQGRVGQYVKVIKGLKVFPIVNITFSVRLF